MHVQLCQQAVQQDVSFSERVSSTCVHLNNRFCCMENFSSLELELECLTADWRDRNSTGETEIIGVHSCVHTPGTAVENA